MIDLSTIHTLAALEALPAKHLPWIPDDLRSDCRALYAQRLRALKVQAT